MPSRWVPLPRPKAEPNARPMARPQSLLSETRSGERARRGRQHSLLRSIIVILLIISLIPILLIGTLNLIRSRQLLDRQASQQLVSIVNHEVSLLTQSVDLRNAVIERMVKDPGFNASLFTLLNTQSVAPEHQQARDAINAIFRSGIQVAPDDFFDQMFIIRPDGSLALSTDNQWITANFGYSLIQHPVIRDLINTNRSIFIYNPVTGYTNKMVLLISRSFVDEKGTKLATLITTSSTELTYQVLSDSSSLLSGANAYYFTPETRLISTGENHQLIRMSENSGLSSVLTPLIGQQSGQSLFNIQSFNRVPVIAFAQWLSKYNIGIVLTVSEQSVYQLSNFADPINLLLLIVSLLICGSIVYFSGIHLVTPLVRVAQAADSFSSGQWDERVEINRSDEIGMLANSFNHMADELSARLASSNRLASSSRLASARSDHPLEEALQSGEQGTAQPPDASVDAAQAAQQVETLTTRLGEVQASFWETALLYQAARQVIHARSEEEILQSLTNTFLQLPFMGVILSVEGENFRFRSVTDPKTGRVDTSPLNLKVPIAHMAGPLLEKPVILVEDISQALATSSDYSNLLSFLLRRGWRSAALIPVRENGRLSKTLMFGYDEKHPITNGAAGSAGTTGSSVLQPYANLAEIIGASLERQHMVSTFQKRLAELQILASFSQAISAETDINNLYHVLHEQVIQTLGPDQEFAVAIYNKNENLIEFPYFYENKAVLAIPPTKLGEGLTSVLIQNRRPLLLRSAESILAYSPIVTGEPARSWMGIPLLFAGDVVGAILIQDLVNENAFSEDDLNLFMTLAPHIATHVRNAQLYSEMQRALHAYDEERFLFNTLLDSIPEGVSIKNTHGEYIRASESIARIFNISPEEIIGKTDYDLLDRETAETVFRAEQAVMSLGRPEIGLIEHSASPTGGETWTQTSRLPIRTAAGDPYGLLLIQSDVTGLKQAEALAQQRAEQVLTAAEIARDATGTLDAKTLLQKSVNLIRDRFGFYQASIFLIDPTGEYAVLRESTGLAGEQMMRAGHRLGVGSKSIVGQVTATRQPLIVNDVTMEPIHKPNELLPETRSELAIPLIVGERILGALDVQSTQANAFKTEDVGILQILADQMAVAVVNSELFTKTQELLAKHRLLRQITIAASSSTNLEDAITNIVRGLRTALVSDRIAIFLLNNDGKLQLQASAGYEGGRRPEEHHSQEDSICGRAVLEKRAILVDNALKADPDNADASDMHSELAIPILFSDAIIGVLDLESKQPHAFDENDQEILSALGNNLGGVIANIRLVTQVRQQVIRERQLFEVTSKIRHSVNLESILETSTKEIARALGARRASIRITAGNFSAGAAANGLPGAERPLDHFGENQGSHGREARGRSAPDGSGEDQT